MFPEHHNNLEESRIFKWLFIVRLFGLT